MANLTTDYTLTMTEKGKKYFYEVKNKEGQLLLSRTSTNPNFVAVMVCEKDGEVFVPNLFFSRFELIGKGDSRNFSEFHILTATLTAGINHLKTKTVLQDYCHERVFINYRLIDAGNRFEVQAWFNGHFLHSWERQTEEEAENVYFKVSSNKIATF